MDSFQYVIEPRHDTFILHDSVERLSDQIDNFKQEESKVHMFQRIDIIDNCWVYFKIVVVNYWIER